MVEFLNANSGFASIVLAVLSLVFSLIAILVSIGIAKQQTQVSLFEKRLEIYNYIENCCNLISHLSFAAKQNKFELLFFYASTYLYPIGSEEKSLAGKIFDVDVQLSHEMDPEKRALLEKQRASLAVRLIPFSAAESQKIARIMSNAHFLFCPSTAHKAVQVLSTYRSFLNWVTLFVDSDFEEEGKALLSLSAEIDLDAFLRDMGNEVMLQHH